MRKLVALCVFLLCVGGVGLSADLFRDAAMACGKGAAGWQRQAAYLLQLSASVLRAEAASDGIFHARSTCPPTGTDAPKLTGKARAAWLASRDRAYNEETARVMQRVLHASANTIDVGTYKGDVLAQMVSFAPRGQHWGFEPIPHLVTGLKRRFARHQGVHIIGAALSDRSGTSTFQYVVSNPGYSGLKRRQYERKETVRPIQVQVKTLDAVLPPRLRIDLIKIDVEGAEYQVLRGAKETILRSRPVIVFEHGKGASDRYGTTPSRLYRLLHRDYGMEINTMARWLAYVPALSLAAFRREYQTGRNWYFIATPRTHRLP